MNYLINISSSDELSLNILIDETNIKLFKNFAFINNIMDTCDDIDVILISGIKYNKITINVPFDNYLIAEAFKYIYALPSENKCDYPLIFLLQVLNYIGFNINSLREIIFSDFKCNLDNNNFCEIYKGETKMFLNKIKNDEQVLELLKELSKQYLCIFDFDGGVISKINFDNYKKSENSFNLDVMDFCFDNIEINDNFIVLVNKYDSNCQEVNLGENDIKNFDLNDCYKINEFTQLCDKITTTHLSYTGGITSNNWNRKEIIVQTLLNNTSLTYSDFDRLSVDIPSFSHYIVFNNYEIKITYVMVYNTLFLECDDELNMYLLNYKDQKSQLLNKVRNLGFLNVFSNTNVYALPSKCENFSLLIKKK